MDALISLVYTIIDSVCVCLFLDAFASHRWRDHRFLVGVIVQTILMYASIEFSVIALNRNQIVKIFLILLSCFIVARTLYENISGRFLLFLIVVEYLLTYSLSFAVGMLATSVCGMDAQTFQADKALSLIYGISYYSAELFIIALFRKMMLQRMGNRPRSDAQHSQLILYFLFPCICHFYIVKDTFNAVYSVKFVCNVDCVYLRSYKVSLWVENNDVDCCWLFDNGNRIRFSPFQSSK